MALLKDWEPGISRVELACECAAAQIHDESLGHAEQIADSGHQHLLQLVRANNLFKNVGEVLDHDDGLGRPESLSWCSSSRACTAGWY